MDGYIVRSKLKIITLNFRQHVRVCSLWGSCICYLLPYAICRSRRGRCRLAGPVKVALFASVGISSWNRHQISTHVIVIKLKSPQCWAFNRRTKWRRIIVNFWFGPRVGSLRSWRLVSGASKSILTLPDFCSITGKATDWIRSTLLPHFAGWFWRGDGELLVHVDCTRSTGLYVRT